MGWSGGGGGWSDEGLGLVEVGLARGLVGAGVEWRWRACAGGGGDRVSGCACLVVAVAAVMVVVAAVMVVVAAVAGLSRRG